MQKDLGLVEVYPTIQTWSKHNVVSSEMVYKDAADAQIDTMSRVHNLLYSSYMGGVNNRVQEDFAREEWRNSIVVISSHTSKSIDLPVCRIQFKDGPTIICRDNFHDWNVSVISDKPIVHNWYDLMATDDISYCFFQGFPKEYQFGTYKENPCQFSTYGSSGLTTIYTFLYLIWEGYVHGLPQGS